MILGADIRRIPGATRTEYDTGVLLDLDLPAYVTNILQLRPGTTDIAVVVGIPQLKDIGHRNFVVPFSSLRTASILLGSMI